MAGSGIRIEVDADTSVVEAALRRLRRRFRNMRPILDDIGSSLENSTLHRFETGAGPGGRRWPISGRARRQGGQTLVNRGRLKDSITHIADNDEVVVGTNVKYGAIHQFGGKTPPRTIVPRDKKALFFPGARHPVAKVDHPGSTIPARPFLGIDRDDEVSILRIIRRAVDRAVG